MFAASAEAVKADPDSILIAMQQRREQIRADMKTRLQNTATTTNQAGSTVYELRRGEVEHSTTATSTNHELVVFENEYNQLMNVSESSAMMLTTSPSDDFKNMI